MLPQVRAVSAGLILGLACAAGACEQARDVTGPSSVGPSNPPAASVTTTLEGFVWDAVLRSIGGATVEIVNQSRTIGTVNTNTAGLYRYSGTFVGDVTVRATKVGYVTATQTVAPRPPPVPFVATFYLDAVAESVEIDTGDYTLTFTAPGCAGLPEDLQTRTLTATITSLRPSQYIATVPGTRHWLSGPGSFWIGASASELIILDDTGPMLREEVSPARQLEFSVWDSFAAATMRVSAMSFRGHVTYCEMTAPGAVQFCQSAPRERIIKQVICPDSRATLTRK